MPKERRASDYNHTVVSFESIKKITDVNAKYNFRKALGGDIETGLKLATDLIGEGLASLESVIRVDNHTQCTAWVNGDPIAGVHFIIPLTEIGVRAVREGRFSPASPDLAHCARPEDSYTGVYIGAYAGATREVRKNIMQGAAALRIICFGALPCFARAATDDGARSMRTLGFQPIEGDPNGLWAQEALTSINQDAA